MKKILILILTISIIPSLIYSSVVIWNGIASDAYDQNVQINGDTWLSTGTTTISACNQDVQVILQQSAHVYSNNSGQSTLRLYAKFPWKIEIIVNHDLKFGGVSQDFDTPLIIQETGDGLIKWIMHEGKAVTFGSGNDDRGGTILEIIWDSLNNKIPKHIFKVRQKDQGAQVIFDARSFLKHVHLTFISPTPYIQPVLIDASDAAPHFYHNVEIKDGSGVFLITELDAG